MYGNCYSMAIVLDHRSTATLLTGNLYKTFSYIFLGVFRHSFIYMNNLRVLLLFTTFHPSVCNEKTQPAMFKSEHGMSVNTQLHLVGFHLRKILVKLKYPTSAHQTGINRVGSNILLIFILVD